VPRNLRWLLLITILLPSPWLAQIRTSQSAGKSSIEGRVLSATTGLPLSKAVVELLPATRNAVTDSNGRFLIEDIDPGNGYITVERTGYARLVVGAAHLPDSVGSMLEVPPGVALKDIVLRVQPQALLAGRVTDEEDAPLPKALVKVWKVGFSNGHRTLRELRPDRLVDADGSFVIGNLEAGRYYLAGFEEQNTEVVLLNEMLGAGPPAIYYPGTLGLRDAQPIDVRPGQEVRDIEIRLKKTRFLQISGTAVNPIPGSKVLESNLWLASKSPFGWASAFTFPVTLDPSTGQFRVHRVVPGDYTITGKMKIQAGGASRSFTAKQDIQISDRSPTGVRIEFLPDAQIMGVVTDGGAFPTPSPMIFVGLKSASADFGLDDSVSVNEARTFRLQVKPGEYRVFAGNRFMPQVHVKSIRFEGQEVMNMPVEISNAGGKLDVKFAKTAGEVSGFVRNLEMQGVGGATVGLWRPDGFFTSVAADPLGRFRIADVPPGAYLLAAWDDLDYGVAEVPMFRAIFERQAVKVNLQDEEHVSVNLTAIARSVSEAEEARLP
jgi:hypothetical protein